jgi:hypothetical protein
MTEPVDQPGGDAPGIWVSSWVLPKGRGYGVRLRVGGTTWGLTPDRALAYAAAVIRAAVTAEHDAAVAGLLMNKLAVPDRLVAELFAHDLRPDRPDTDADTGPLLLRPGVAVDEHLNGSRTFRPFIGLHLADTHIESGRPAWSPRGEKVGQFTPADARQHATAVLDTIAAADLDSALRRLLVGPLGLGEARASAVIADLANHWPATEEPRRA